MVELHLSEICLAESNIVTAFERIFLKFILITDLFSKGDQIGLSLMGQQPQSSVFPVLRVLHVFLWFPFWGGAPGASICSCIDYLACGALPWGRIPELDELHR